MASSDGQGDHDALVYYLQRTRKLTFTEVRNTTLPQELSADHDYSNGWEAALKLYMCRRLSHHRHNWDLMEKECFVAVMCYTLVFPKIGRRFNEHCRQARPTAESWNAFPFKSLFFFLIEAFEKLPPFPTGTLYRGIDMLDMNAQDRAPFVQFVSASTSSDIARRFGTTLLVLTGVPSSVVRDISLYSAKDYHQEVLIWPFCTFDVVDIGSSVTFLDIGGLKTVYGSPRVELAFRDANPSVGQR